MMDGKGASYIQLPHNSLHERVVRSLEFKSFMLTYLPYALLACFLLFLIISSTLLTQKITWIGIEWSIKSIIEIHMV